MQTDGVSAMLAAGDGTDGWETGGAGVDVETAGDDLACPSSCQSRAHNTRCPVCHLPAHPSAESEPQA